MSELKLDGKGKTFGIVVSRFNEYITRILYEGCVNTLVKLGVNKKNISTIWVPGLFEIPSAVRRILRKKVDAIITLGCAIKGETRHFEHLSREVIASLCEINRTQDIPVVTGIILAENLTQAIERSGSKLGNKGKEAALAAVEMSNLDGL